MHKQKSLTSFLLSSKQHLKISSLLSCSAGINMVNYFENLLKDLLNEDMPIEAFEDQWIEPAQDG